MKQYIIFILILIAGFANSQNFIMVKPVIDSSKIRQGPAFCGFVRNISINCMENNENVTIQNGIWQKKIHIQSVEAKSMEIVFSKFRLNSNTIVSLYSNSGLSCQYKGNLFIERYDNVRFESDPIDGDICDIVIQTPVEELQDNEIVISKVRHYIESLSSILAKASEDYPCMKDANCTEGNGWCDQKRSVAKYFFDDDGMEYSCTGALVNSYRNNFEQYFLTARHCTDGNIDWDHTRFYFNYQKESCNGMFLSNNYVVRGARLLDYCAKALSDVALLRITEPIPVQYNIFYAGVDVNNRSMGDDVTCIHHSEGKPKKITKGEIEYYAGYKWDVYWDDGVIASGGSGAPVFLNSNKRVIATISSGPNYDCNSSMKHDWVGKVKGCSDVEDILFDNSDSKSIAGRDPIRDCQSILNLSGNFFPMRDYDATLNSITIQASQIINVSSATFKTSSTFILTAGEKITLQPGFKVEAGAKFLAKISPCSTNLQFCGEH
jgi:hypothetical protein